MLDKNGFRLNVGIILLNAENKVFWGKRTGIKNAWQFPQGGVNSYETLEETMYRELVEEVGLDKEDVKILGATKRWVYYRLPYHMRRLKQIPVCIGQKQKWFLLKLISDENNIRFDRTDAPEFVAWHWVDYWEPLKHVIYFKRNVYRKALRELAKYLPLLNEENRA